MELNFVDLQFDKECKLFYVNKKGSPFCRIELMATNSQKRGLLMNYFTTELLRTIANKRDLNELFLSNLKLQLIPCYKPIQLQKK